VDSCTLQETTRARLAAIVDSSDDAIIGKDLTGRVTSWNRAAEQMFGFTANEMVGTSVMRLIPADHGEEERQIIEQIRRGERVQHYETRWQTKDGPLIDVSITVSAIKDAVGTVIGVSKVARDITERKRAEQVVRQASGRVARNRRTQAGIDLAILATATASIYMLAARFAWFEGIARWVLTHDRQQLPEMMLSAVFITLGLLAFGFRRWRESESDLMSRQQAQAALGLLHDELDRRVKQRTQELGDANQALHTEIAEHRRTGEALRTAEERMRFALESAKVGIWDIDCATGAVQWSGVLEAQYGLQPGTFGGTFEAFIERIHPDDRESVNDTCGKAMKSGADFSLVNRSLSPDGVVRWLLGAGRIRLGEHGEPVRGIGISQDVTELKRLNDEMQLQRLRVFKATIRTVQDIVNNLLNGFHLVRLEGEGQLSAELLTLVDQMIQEAGVKLKTLGDLETVNEKEMAIGLGIDYPGAGF
jgi:PAS domain S-box-containing protein